MKKIVTFGEIMLRLSPPGFSRLLQTPSLDATFGGAEANVAVSLANFGMEARFVTKVPDNPIGRAALSELKKFGVDTSFCALGGERLGLYYIEKGASQRASLCVYDRKRSAVSECSSGDFDWKKILKGAAAFHVTGITPALSASAFRECLEAAKTARSLGALVFCDLNYRKKLWSRAAAKKAMTALCQNVDVCILNEEDAEDVFGIKAPRSNVLQGRLDQDGYQKVAAALFDRFAFTAVAISQRESYSASVNGWSGLFFSRGQKMASQPGRRDGRDPSAQIKMFRSKKYELQLVDRLGGGDAFAAGIICALLNKMSGQETVEFAAAAGALKQTMEGDFSRASFQEVSALAKGDGSGRILR